jgi:hypothetical protein
VGVVRPVPVARTVVRAVQPGLRLRASHDSTSLHPFAPPELPGFFATMGALTPGRPALRILIRDNEHRLECRPGLPASRHRTFRPFRLQAPAAVPGHLWGSCAGLTGPRRRGRPFGAARPWASPLTGRLATTVGRIEFTGVTDRSFTSGCSPPRLAATQLPSVTGCQSTPAGTFTLPIRCAYRRTCRPFGAGGSCHPARFLGLTPQALLWRPFGADEDIPDRL